MLKNMVALVTGGAGSLGSATAKKLISEGYKVMVFDLPEAKDLVKKILPESVVYAAGNVQSEKDIQNALNKIKSTFGRLDVLVNCAGISRARQLYNPNKKTSALYDEFNELLQVNVGGTYNMIRLSVPLMSENEMDEDGLRGVVINTSGFYAFDGQIGQCGMSAVGGAISSMTLPLCRDLAIVGIRAMAIAPGIIQSNLTSELPKKVVDHINVFTPGPKRLGLPDEYALLVKTIIENKYLNGETIRLDGGLRTYLI